MGPNYSNSDFSFSFFIQFFSYLLILYRVAYVDIPFLILKVLHRPPKFPIFCTVANFPPNIWNRPPVGSQFQIVVIRVKKLFEWNLFLTNGVQRECGWFAHVSYPWRLDLMEPMNGDRPNTLRESSDWAARGLPYSVREREVGGSKIIRHSQGVGLLDWRGWRV